MPNCSLVASPAPCKNVFPISRSFPVTLGSVNERKISDYIFFQARHRALRLSGKAFPKHEFARDCEARLCVLRRAAPAAGFLPESPQSGISFPSSTFRFLHFLRVFLGFSNSSSTFASSSSFFSSADPSEFSNTSMRNKTDSEVFFLHFATKTKKTFNHRPKVSHFIHFS